MDKQQLKSILERHEGREMAISSRELSRLMGEEDRAIRLTIEDLIEEGLPVVSTTESPAGYFIPLSLDEAKEYTRSLRSRAVRIFLRSRKVKQNASLYLKPASQGRLL
jgi:hypothetical protein